MPENNVRAKIIHVSEHVKRGARFYTVTIQAEDERTAQYLVKKPQLEELKNLVGADSIADLIGAIVTIPEKELRHAA